MKLSDIHLFEVQIGDREWDNKLTKLLKRLKSKVKREKYMDFNTFSKVRDERGDMLFMSNTCIDSYNNLISKERKKSELRV